MPVVHSYPQRAPAHSDDTLQTVKEVPSEKVISGIPFFTRVWKETPKTDAELAKAKGTDNEDYTMNVESTAYGMAEAQTVVEQVGVTAEWDDKTKQNYAAFFPSSECV